MTSHSADGEVSDQNSVTATASVFAEPCASKGNRCATRYPAHTAGIEQATQSATKPNEGSAITYLGLMLVMVTAWWIGKERTNR